MIRGAYGRWIPPRLRLALFVDVTKLVLDGLFRHGPVVAENKPKAKRKEHGPATDMTPMEDGPVAILSYDPPIFMTGIAFEEYVGIAPAFGRTYGSLPAAFLIYPCWTIEDAYRSGRVIEAAKAHQAEYPAHELVFLCNTAAERDVLTKAGLTAHLLNKNFTVSDSIFRPLPDAQIEFDAVYNARFDPRKRHNLASRVARVGYISFATGSTGTLKDQRESLAETLARYPGHALINSIENGLPVPLPPEGVNAGLARAVVGLCLSTVEGSNYASMEYMLAGLPIVSTPSIGGREVYFDHEFCTICEPNAAAVRDAVETLKARNIPRDYIRARTLAKIEPERRRFLSLIDDLSERLGGKRRHDEGVWPYGATNRLVTWKKYRSHLQEFEKGGGSSDRGNGHGANAEIEGLLAKTEGVQMQPAELLAIVGAIRLRPGCSLLIFGCGNDSVFWEEVNQGGTTAFIEDDPVWAEKIRAKLKTASVHLTQYGTRLSEWVGLLNSSEGLELELPDAVSSRRWDVIVIDGPAGHDNHEKYTGREAPGRMKSIYMASKLVAPGGFVFVHDCDRLVEQQYAARYLGNERAFVSVKGHAILHGYAF